MKTRQAKISRQTKETKISLRLNLDGKGKSSVKTGIPFFDHMLTLFAKHATVDLQLNCKGDLEVDAHHTVEDCSIALGQAFVTALGDKKGIRRYGFGFDPKNPFTGEAFVPMDECLARCVVDFSGRSHLVWRGLDKFSQKKISDSEKSQDASSAFRLGLARESEPERARGVLTFFGIGNFFLRKFVQSAPDEVRPSAEIHDTAGETFVHRHKGFAGERIFRMKAVAVAPDAALVTKRDGHGLPQRDPTVLNGVMRIHSEVTVANQLQIH